MPIRITYIAIVISRGYKRRGGALRPLGPIKFSPTSLTQNSNTRDSDIASNWKFMKNIRQMEHIVADLSIAAIAILRWPRDLQVLVSVQLSPI